MRPRSGTSIPRSLCIASTITFTTSAWRPDTCGGGPPDAYSRRSVLARNIAILQAARPTVAFRVHVENVPSPRVRWRLPSSSVAVTSWTNARSLLSVYDLWFARGHLSRFPLRNCASAKLPNKVAGVALLSKQSVMLLEGLDGLMAITKQTVAPSLAATHPPID